MKNTRDDIMKNAEGYNDPTAGEAIKNIMEKNPNKFDEARDVARLIRMFHGMCHLAGFEVKGRIVLKNKKSRRIYK